ncbi:MAG: ArnT family glycosyltransferase, partial [Ktedonobacterales bacterium]
SQPPSFLLSLYPFYLLFGQTLVAARLAVVLYSIIGVVAIYFAARAIAGPWTGVVAATLLAIDPLYLTGSYTLQAEVPALAFEIACVAFAATAIQQSGRRRRIMASLSGVALGLGVMTKLFDVVAIVPAVLYLSQPFFHAFTDDDGRLRRPTGQDVSANVRAALPVVALFAGGLVVTCAVVLAPFAGHWGALYDQAVQFHVVAGHAVNRGLTFNVKLLLGIELSANVSHYALGEYPLIGLALVAVVLGIWRRDWRIVPPLLWAMLSFALLLRQQPLFDHHRVLLSPPLALLGALVVPLASLATSNVQPFSSRRQEIRAVSPRMARLATICVWLVVLVSLATSMLAVRDAAQSIPTTQREMALVLRTETLPQDQVVTDDQYIAGVADRTVPPQLVDTSQVRIASGYLTAQQLESIITRADARVILFASGRFDGVPGFREWVRENYIQVADFGGGRALYIRQPSGPPIA